MNIVVDTHTHTLSSGHAYSTLQENAKEAAANGIKIMAMTDHGPAMGGAPHLYHFGNLHSIPDVIHGVRIVRGVEANIMDFEGNTDMPDKYLKKLEFAMASFHDICIAPIGREEHTRAVIGALSNPYIDAIAHSGNPKFPIDIDQMVRAAAEHQKLIEINNFSFTVRAGCEENCLEIAMKCKKYGVRIICGSDAHISYHVGRFDKVYTLLEQAGIPEELVLNASTARFEEYLLERKDRIKT